MRLIFADQPFLSVPGTAAALAGDALDAAPDSRVLRAKDGELFFGPDLDVIVLAFSGGPWFRSAPAFRLRPGVFSRRHASPCLLSFLDVLPGSLSFFSILHLIPSPLSYSKPPRRPT